MRITATDFLEMKKRTGEPLEAGWLAVGVEYLGRHGYASAFYTARLTPESMRQEELLALGEVRSVALREKEDKSWMIRFRGSDPEVGVEEVFSGEEAEKLFKRFGLLPLPGMEDGLDDPLEAMNSFHPLEDESPSGRSVR